ncbi:MAG: IS1634 family transposase [Bacilli bacterium]|nr:IS1634 family transposase [Bacilli bacterium]
MFIEKVNNNGIEYLRLVENMVVTRANGKKGYNKKILLSIGPLSKFNDGKPDYLKRLRKSFKNGVPLIDSLKPFCENNQKLETYEFKLTEGEDACIGHPKLYSHNLIERILEELGLISLFASYKANTKIEFDLVGFFRLLIYGRILNPSSKIAATKQNDDYYDPIIKDMYNYNVYDTLDFIHDYKRQITNRINNQLIKKVKRNTSIIYYDVTNFFFEIEENDEDIIVDGQVQKGIRKKGVCKEHRPQPIVQMGLFMDSSSLPISIEMFPGNTLDHLTVKTALANNIDGVINSRYIFVGDRGICNYNNISHLLGLGKGYILSKSILKLKKEEKAWITNPEGYLNKGANFKYKSRIIRREITTETGEKKEIVEKVVCYWSKKYYDKQVKENKSFLDFLDKLLKSPANFRITRTQSKRLASFLKKDVVNEETGEILDSSKLKGLIDLNKVNKFIEFFGYYQIITSELDMDDLEIIDIYHGLSEIENQFRIMKSDLNTRPIFVRRPEHIEAHLTVCLIALIVLRVIQKKIISKLEKSNKAKEVKWEMGLTGSSIQDALNKWTIDELPGGRYRFNNIDEGNLKIILNAFDIEIPKKVYTKNELKNIKTSIKIFS